MIIIMMMKITKMAITQPILKIGPPDFAWDQIYIIPTDDYNEYNDN